MQFGLFKRKNSSMTVRTNLTYFLNTFSDPSIPTDNPGLPIQDEVCPFHQRMSYWAETLQKNRLSEMQKNDERFQFLKYVDSSFDNITVIPPGTGKIVCNLRYNRTDFDQF